MSADEAARPHVGGRRISTGARSHGGVKVGLNGGWPRRIAELDASAAGLGQPRCLSATLTPRCARSDAAVTAVSRLGYDAARPVGKRRPPSRGANRRRT